MEENTFFAQLLAKFRAIVQEHQLMDETVTITGTVLSSEDAIGHPDRQDFPLLTGKERLMQAEFRGAKGQAFTDMPGPFSGSIQSIVDTTPQNNWQRAVLIATLNAVCAYLKLTDRTVHCKNNEPEVCARQLVTFIEQQFTQPKIALVGFQPSMLEALARKFSVRNLDLDEDKIGKMKFGVRVEDGIRCCEEVLDWCDVIVATGSTSTNGSIVNYLRDKPVLFYGTTVSGTAALMDLPRFCACAS